MPDFVPPEWIIQWGWLGIGVAAVLAVLRGYLYPRSTVQDQRLDFREALERLEKERDERVTEVTAIANTFREAYDTEREARLVNLQSVDQILGTVETTLHIIQAWDKALPRILDGERDE